MGFARLLITHIELQMYSTCNVMKTILLVCPCRDQSCSKFGACTSLPDYRSSKACSKRAWFFSMPCANASGSHMIHSHMTSCLHKGQVRFERSQVPMHSG